MPLSAEHVSWYTVSEPVELVGDPYFRGQPDRIIVHPNPRGDGVFFVHKHAILPVPLQMQNVHAVREYTARFNIIRDARFPELTWKVVEHTVFALGAALGLGAGASALVEVPTSKRAFFLPVIPIREQCEALYAARQPLESKRITHDRAVLHLPWQGTLQRKWYTLTVDQNSVTYSIRDSELQDERSIRLISCSSATSEVEPTLTVLEWKQRDVGILKWLRPQPFTMPLSADYLFSHPEVLEAKPIGRLQNRAIYALMQLLTPTFDFRGISSKNYNVAVPGEQPMEFVANMHPAFQEAQNERYVHAALDALSELMLVPIQMQCAEIWFSVELKNTNHLFRVTALKNLYKEWCFTAATTPMPS